MVNDCAEFEPVTGFGLTELIEGDGVAGAVTVKLDQPEVFPSGFVTRTCQVPGSLSLLIW
jgi:hypothetical protein